MGNFNKKDTSESQSQVLWQKKQKLFRRELFRRVDIALFVLNMMSGGRDMTPSEIRVAANKIADSIQMGNSDALGELLFSDNTQVTKDIKLNYWPDLIKSLVTANDTNLERNLSAVILTMGSTDSVKQCEELFGFNPITKISEQPYKTEKNPTLKSVSNNTDAVNKYSLGGCLRFVTTEMLDLVKITEPDAFNDKNLAQIALGTNNIGKSTSKEQADSFLKNIKAAIKHQTDPDALSSVLKQMLGYAKRLFHPSHKMDAYKELLIILQNDRIRFVSTEFKGVDKNKFILTDEEKELLDKLIETIIEDNNIEQDNDKKKAGGDFVKLLENLKEGKFIGSDKDKKSLESDIKEDSRLSSKGSTKKGEELSSNSRRSVAPKSLGSASHESIVERAIASRNSSGGGKSSKTSSTSSSRTINSSLESDKESPRTLIIFGGSENEGDLLGFLNKIFSTNCENINNLKGSVQKKGIDNNFIKGCLVDSFVEASNNGKPQKHCVTLELLEFFDNKLGLGIDYIGLTNKVVNPKLIEELIKANTVPAVSQGEAMALPLASPVLGGLQGKGEERSEWQIRNRVTNVSPPSSSSHQKENESGEKERPSNSPSSTSLSPLSPPQGNNHGERGA